MGIMTLIKNDLIKACQCIHTSDRCVIVEIDDILFANVYLPCNGTADRQLICSEVLNSIFFGLVNTTIVDT
jgi:exonuclease III